MALLKARGVAFVVHGRGEDDPDYAYYDIDNTGAFTLATQLLADLGHKRIAFTNGPEDQRLCHPAQGGVPRGDGGRGDCRCRSGSSRTTR